MSEQPSKEEELAQSLTSFYQALVKGGLEQWVALTLTERYLLVKASEANQAIPVTWPSAPQRGTE